MTTQFYGVEPIGNFHDATADTVAAVDLIKPITKLHEELARMPLSEIMSWQRNAYNQWKNSFNDWLVSIGKEPINGSWL